jgi:transposase
MTMKRNRRKFSSKFKTKVVLASLTERETIQQLATRFEIHPNQISQWKRQFLDGADTVFDGSSKTSSKESEKVEDKLYKKIGYLQVQVDFLKKNLGES